MRIVLLSEIFPPKVGGSGRYLWEVYRRLPQAECVIVAGEDARQETFDATHNRDVIRMPLTLRRWGVLDRGARVDYKAAVESVRNVVATRKIDRIHAGRCLPEGWIAYLLRRQLGLPYLIHVHGEDMNLDHGGIRQGIMSSRQHRWMARRVVRGADLVVANSHNSAKIVTDQWGVSPARVQVLHPGVDSRQFTPAPRNVSVRHRLGWGDRTVVLTVGRLQARKGHERMIRALHTVRQAVPGVLYAIVGEGQERDALESLVDGENLSDHVRFLGAPDDDVLVSCYQQCDVFVLPNRQIGTDIEGFGMVLVEAQACGRSVVAGASGGTAESMNIPQTGLTVSCETPDELAALVVELLRDRPRLEQMGAAARRWVVERFDWERVAARAARIFSGELDDGPQDATDVDLLLEAEDVACRS